MKNWWEGEQAHRRDFNTVVTIAGHSKFQFTEDEVALNKPGTNLLAEIVVFKSEMMELYELGDRTARVKAIHSSVNSINRVVRVFGAMSETVWGKCDQLLVHILTNELGEGKKLTEEQKTQRQNVEKLEEEVRKWKTKCQDLEKKLFNSCVVCWDETAEYHVIHKLFSLPNCFGLCLGCTKTLAPDTTKCPMCQNDIDSFTRSVNHCNNK